MANTVGKAGAQEPRDVVQYFAIEIIWLLPLLSDRVQSGPHPASTSSSHAAGLMPLQWHHATRKHQQSDHYYGRATIQTTHIAYCFWTHMRIDIYDLIWGWASNCLHKNWNSATNIIEILSPVGQLLGGIAPNKIIGIRVPPWSLRLCIDMILCLL